jgi:hypothetical protein
MGKTIGHIAVIGGLAFPVISEVFSFSQSNGFKWNFLSVLACALLGLYVLYAAWYVRRGRREKGSNPEFQGSFARQQLKDLYSGLLVDGTACLRQLEEASEQMTHPGWSEKQMNELARFVDNYILRCQTWMAKTHYAIVNAAGKSNADLFSTSPPTRSKPSYIENQPELGIWQHTAGRLDWLRDEIAK